MFMTSSLSRVIIMTSSLYRGLSSSIPRRRRALLYMPGDDLRKITKAASLDVDLAVLDCEDAVAVSRKGEARTTITKALATLDFGRTERGVRINSVSSGLIEDDITSILSGSTLPDVLMVPKVDTPEEAVYISELVSKSGLTTPLPLIFQTESALGLVNLREIILTLQRSTVLRAEAVVFGSDDYVSDIRGSRDDIMAVVYARQKVVTLARAYGLQPIDRVYIEYKDTEGLRAESEQGFGFGFTGKQCIHPGQIQIVQQAFSPSETQIEHARALISAFSENQAAGKGAFSFRGKMIDRPTLLQAQNLVDMFGET